MKALIAVLLMCIATWLLLYGCTRQVESHHSFKNSELERQAMQRDYDLNNTADRVAFIRLCQKTRTQFFLDRDEE